MINENMCVWEKQRDKFVIYRHLTEMYNSQVMVG